LHWTAGSEKIFVQSRNTFVNSNHLVQPEETLRYVVNANASDRAIGAFIDANRGGETHVVSTVSRVLIQTECRYSAADKELPAIVFA